MNLKTFGYHTPWQLPSGRMNWAAVAGDVLFGVCCIAVPAIAVTAAINLF